MLLEFFLHLYYDFEEPSGLDQVSGLDMNSAIWGFIFIAL